MIALTMPDNLYCSECGDQLVPVLASGSKAEIAYYMHQKYTRPAHIKPCRNAGKKYRPEGGIQTAVVMEEIPDE